MRRIEPYGADKYKHPVIYVPGVSEMAYLRPGGNMAYSQISIRLGGLMVELGTEATYPDMVSDLTGRCLSTFKDAMDKAVEAGVDVSDMRLITSDYSDDDED